MIEGYDTIGDVNEAAVNELMRRYIVSLWALLD